MDVTCPSEQTPGDLFAPFGSLQKGLAAGAAKSPPTKRRGAKPAGGASPSPTDTKGCKWDGRVWDPPLQRHKGHKGPTGVGVAFGRLQTARRVVAPHRVASSDTRRTMIRHCEEGHRPDVAIRSPVKRERIPTAPPGPRNDGVGTQGTPANGAPSGRAPQGASSGTHRTTGGRPGEARLNG